MTHDGVLRNLRRQHELLVLTTLVERGPCSRRDLEQVTGLSRTTMSAIVGDLVRRRAVLDDVQAEPARRSRGRPAALLRLNPRAASTVGIELGRGHVSVAVGDIGRTIVVHETVPVEPHNGDLHEELSAALSLLDAVTAERGLELDELCAVGLGLWGQHPDPIADSSGESTHDAVVTELVERIRTRLGVPVVWDHNIRLAAMAEARAVESPPCTDLVYVVLSHGVGGGAVVEGNLARGASGTAGEIGHVSVEPSGPPCWCGGRGCLEGYLSVGSLLSRARAVAPEIEDVDDVLAALERPNPAVRELVEWSGELLGRALATVATMLDPHRVVVGGELAVLGEHLLGPIRTALDRQKLSIRDRRLELDTALISEGAAAVGAVSVALDRYVSWRTVDGAAEGPA